MAGATAEEAADWISTLGCTVAAGEANETFPTDLRPKVAGPRGRVPPLATNYDVHSPSWGDGKPVLLPSAMEATSLGHGPS
ncbi:hypothetical protein DAI22_04g246100 [Oryza sativa Japonica Group]|nr:hypothetical protein DAI22_04g246100 [Oryza sativa Japonica Group]